MLTKSEFYKFISSYKPSQYDEVDRKDPRYDCVKKYTNQALIGRERFYVTLKYALKYFSKEPFKVLDIGPYPGTFLRILREFLSHYKLDLYGAGIHIDPSFLKLMEDHDIKIMTVNVDPKNIQLAHKNYPHTIPLEDESIDFIFALEIVEHLVSPSHMIFEARRVLKKEGKFLIATPNISRIGSVFKLLAGRTNLNTLGPPGYYDEDDEWRPHVREYSMGELERLVSNIGFEVVDKIFFNSNLTRFNIKTIPQQLIDFMKIPFYFFPHFREHLLIIGKK